MTGVWPSYVFNAEKEGRKEDLYATIFIELVWSTKDSLYNQRTENIFLRDKAVDPERAR